MERLRSISWLVEEAGTEISTEYLEQYEETARALNQQFGVLPTIGCEIEVKPSAVYPELFYKYLGAVDSVGRFAIGYSEMSDENRAAFDTEYNELEATTRPRYEATERAGIPADKDAYWEFANLPTYSWKTLSTEVELLMKAGLIPMGHEHALHVTLGAHNSRGGMCLVLSGLELLYANPERIAIATEGNRFGSGLVWARRGQDGLRDRIGNEVLLSQRQATELRTLSLSTPEDTRNIFFTAQMLTATLMAFRQRKQPDANALVKDIAELWPEYRQALRDLWDANDLPAASWGKPHHMPERWLKWAQIIADRKDDEHARNVVEAAKQVTQQAHLLLWMLASETEAVPA